MIIKKEQDAIQNYFEDNSGVKGAFADFAAIPENEEDIKTFLIEMSKSKTPVTVVGALTGNTAGGLAFGGAVLSLERLNRIGEIEIVNENSAFIEVQCGARLCDIKSKVKSNGWMYPVDPTEITAAIGGNISTNASGGRGFKFGVTRDYIQSLKVVFSDGSQSFIERGKYIADDGGSIVFDTDKYKKQISLPKYILPKGVKNAAGYYNYPNADLVDVLIGSEGTLCIVVCAKLKLIPHFKELFGGIVFFNEREDCCDFVNKVKEISKKSKKENLRNSISAVSLEYFDKNALSLIKSDYPLIPNDAAAGLMFEQDIYDGESEVLMEKWIELIENSGINLEKVWFAENLEQMEQFRTFRHKIPERVNEIIRKNKIAKIGTDFAVPEGKLFEIMNFCDNEFKRLNIFNLTFGHIGENHLHANIIAATREEYETCRTMYAGIAAKAVELGGTVSAEHGIGKLRHIFLEKMLGENGFIEMAKFKKSFDVANILGRGNIFPEKYLSND
jgi:D-lactate dehydrogenase (cytochrome)